VSCSDQMYRVGANTAPVDTDKGYSYKESLLYVMNCTITILSPCVRSGTGLAFWGLLHLFPHMSKLNMVQIAFILSL